MDRLENFSYEARGLLFDYLEEYEEGSGEEMELDVVAVCCDFSEDSAEDIAANYSLDVEGLDEEETADIVRDYLNENTILVGETSSGFVYQVF
ncbi:MAG: hypothetical protein B7Z31_00110 [Rhodobacterales bacterium 12-65-15]|nr:MAG: hypothetical protein B7Z31_00110 [Rhodobacterales bacterium 12-65-15]